MRRYSVLNRPAQNRSRGFSLVELMVALGVFLLVGGAAVALLRQHMPLFTRQQNQAALNTALRNAAAQLQLDVVNAGAGYYNGTDIAAFPIGVSAVNRIPGGGNTCYDAATFSYNGSCFDTLNVITTDITTPPTYPTDSTGTKCADTSQSDLYLQIPGNPAPTNAQLSTLAGQYHNGDEVLLVNSQGQFTAVKLTQDADVQAPLVRLRHNTTDGTGLNTSTTQADGSILSSNDPLLISVSDPGTNHLTNSFCSPLASSVTSWVLRLTPVTYFVDTTDPTDPQLRRIQGNSNDIVADQVIGFKVGVMTRGKPDENAYQFDYATAANYANTDWTQVLSVRVSLIGRTSPTTSANAGDNFRNNFDGGPYRIDAVSVVVNPRNLNTLN